MNKLALNFFGRIGSSLAIVALNIILISVLEKNEYAKYGYAFSIAMLASIFVQGGSAQSANRFISEDLSEANELLFAAAKIILKNYTIFLLILWVAHRLGVFLVLSEKEVFFVSLWALSFGLQSVVSEFLRIKGEFLVSAISSGFISNSAILLYAVFMHKNLFSAENIIIASALMPFSCLIFLKKVYVPIKNKKYINLKEYNSSATHNMLAAGFSTLIMQSPALLIGFFGTKSQIADYSVASRFLSVVMIFYSILSQTYSRSIAVMFLNKDIVGANIFAQNVALKIFFGMLIAVSGVNFFLYLYIDSMWGGEYSGGYWYFLMMSVALLINSATGLRSQFLINSGGERYLYKISITMGLMSFLGGGLIMASASVEVGVLFSMIVFVLTGGVEFFVLSNRFGVYSILKIKGILWK